MRKPEAEDRPEPPASVRRPGVNGGGRASAIVRRRYDRVAPLFDLIEQPLESTAFANWRRRLVRLVEGPEVLEAGVGTGKNLAHYPPDLRLTAIDLSPNMLVRSRHKRCASVTRRALMDVERLGFADDTFDTVVASFLFCSVADPVRGLRELGRVVKEGGRILLLEHVRPGHRLLGNLFDLFNPIVVRLVGANINRDTVANARRAGLAIEQETNLAGDMVKLVVCGKGKGSRGPAPRPSTASPG